jgi:putative transposase
LIKSICRIAGVSRSGYYAFLRNPSSKFDRDQDSLRIIQEAFLKSREKAGIITLDLTLRMKGIIINHKKIARIKRDYNLITKIRQKNPYKGISTNAKVHRHIPNLLNRDFIQAEINRAYSTDMTYLFYGKCEKAYLSATKDLATNEIISYKLMRSPTIHNFVEEFRDLLTSLPKQVRKQLIIHSDQGYQYTHPTFVDLLAEFNVTQSMSRRGNCLDNAPIETFFGHFKDLIDVKTCSNFEELKIEIDRTIKYYNYDRPQKRLNKKPPAEYRGLISSFF